MAKPKTPKRDTITISLPLPVFQLKCKFGKQLLIPSNALDDRYTQILCSCKTPVDFDTVRKGWWQTTDGNTVKVQFTSGYNNQGNYFDDELDKLSKKLFGEKIGFNTLKSIWYNRTGSSDNYWHLIELEEIYEK